MKLRIRSNTLRFRLGRDEIADLAGGGFVEETVRFGPLPEDELVYRVESSDAIQRIGLRYAPGRITVLLASTLCRDWLNSDKVGFGENVSVGNDIVVSVAIEKDFACLSARDAAEDEGAFPHPRVGRSSQSGC